MADMFHNLEEAAKLLNISPDKLGAMRENGEIRGFRDGSTWKFKTSEVEQLAGQASADDGSSELEYHVFGFGNHALLRETWTMCCYGQHGPCASTGIMGPIMGWPFLRV